MLVTSTERWFSPSTWSFMLSSKKQNNEGVAYDNEQLLKLNEMMKARDPILNRVAENTFDNLSLPSKDGRETSRSKSSKHWSSADSISDNQPLILFILYQIQSIETEQKQDGVWWFNYLFFKATAKDFQIRLCLWVYTKSMFSIWIAFKPEIKTKSGNVFISKMLRMNWNLRQ